MKVKNNIKNTRFIVLAVFFFCFIRSVVFSSYELIGFNFEKKEVLFDLSSVLFLSLVFLYSLLTASLVFTLYNKHEEKCWLPCLLLITDTAFLINQMQFSILLIRVLWLLYFICISAGKTVIKNLSQIAFLFAASIISPEVTLGFIPLIILTEFIPDINNAQKVKKTVIPRFLSVLATALGIAVNYVLYANVSQFKSFIDFLNPSLFVEKEKAIGTLLLSIPGLVIGAYFIYIHIGKYSNLEKNTGKRREKRRTAEKLLNIVFVALAAVFVGGIFGGYEAVSAISLFVPVIILMLLSSEDKAAGLTLSDIDSLVLKHPVASAAIFMSIYYICLRFYLWRFGGSSMAFFFIWNK